MTAQFWKSVTAKIASPLAPGHVALSVMFEPGYGYLYPTPHTYTYTYTPPIIVVNTTPLATLTLKVNTAGDGTPACAGYVTADEAKAFYTGAETVKLEAVPQPGYVFSHWTGTGKAFVSAENQGPNDAQDLDDEENPIRLSEIWVEMGIDVDVDGDGITERVPQNRTVTAVFERIEIKTAELAVSPNCNSQTSGGAFGIANFQPLTDRDGHTISVTCDENSYIDNNGITRYYYNYNIWYDDRHISECIYDGGQNVPILEYLEIDGEIVFWGMFHSTTENPCLPDAITPSCMEFTSTYTTFRPWNKTTYTNQNFPVSCELVIGGGPNYPIFTWEDVGYIRPENRPSCDLTDGIKEEDAESFCPPLE